MMISCRRVEKRTKGEAADVADPVEGDEVEITQRGTCAGVFNEVEDLADALFDV